MTDQPASNPVLKGYIRAIDLNPDAHQAQVSLALDEQHETTIDAPDTLATTLGSLAQAHTLVRVEVKQSTATTPLTVVSISHKMDLKRERGTNAYRLVYRLAETR